VANTRSAEKRNRQAEKNRLRNASVRSTVKTAVKKVRDAVAKNDPAVKDLFRQAAAAIDKASSKGVVHARTASRKVARLAKALDRAAK
jgi:small subunit ribosomal protein S20